MTENEQWEFVVVLPNGQEIPATRATTSQQAMARAMRMDVPSGCKVVPRETVNAVQDSRNRPMTADRGKVEAAAFAIYMVTASRSKRILPWASLTENRREIFREEARAALWAARELDACEQD